MKLGWTRWMTVAGAVGTTALAVSWMISNNLHNTSLYQHDTFREEIYPPKGGNSLQIAAMPLIEEDIDSLQAVAFSQQTAATLPNTQLSSLSSSIVEVVNNGIHNPLDDLAREGLLLDIRERKLPGNRLERIYIRKTSFKYPFLRFHDVVEVISADEEIIHSRSAAVADHLIVKRPENLSEEEFKNRLGLVGAQVRDIISDKQGVKLAEFPVGSIDTLENMLEKIKRSGSVVYAEKDEIVTTMVTPNDTLFENLWGLRNTAQVPGSIFGADISVTSAWEITRGSANVKVAVIDTGVDYNHPDLAANIWNNPGEIPNGQDSDGNGFVDDIRGWNFFARNNDPMDGNRHGTHCAGTIGAVGNNALGVTGVCWQVSIIPIRFMSDGGAGATSDAVRAVNYATTVGAHIISNSWGGGGYSQSLFDAIMNAHNAGSLFVAAAGNDGRDNDSTPVYPAGYNVPSIISVAASTASDALASFSNFGASSVHIAAPGSGIWSTSLNNGYESLSGTSMATPHVAGVAALLKAQQPNISRDLLRQRLLASVDAIDTLQGRVSTGGRLNAHRALIGNPASAYLALASVQISEQGTEPDGIVSPGENIVLTPRIRNLGAVSAYGVIARLVSNDPHVIVTQNTTSISAVAPGEVASASAGWNVSVSPTSPSPRNVSLTVVMNDAAGGTWQSTTTLNIFRVFNVSGTVRDLGTQQPIANARIVMSGPSQVSALSASNGGFSFRVKEGTHTLTCSINGFFPISQTIAISSNHSDLLVELGRPLAAVTPASLTSSAPVGGSTTRTITIANNGSLPLEWSAKSVSFEYEVTHSGQPGGPQFIWNDISDTGTSIPTGTWFIAIHPEQRFPLYGEPQDHLIVSPHGFLTSTRDLVISSSGNRSLPNNHISVNPQSLFFQWTRMQQPQVDNARSHFLTMPDRTIYQYTGHAYRNLPASLTTGQVVVHQNGEIFFYYQRVDRPDTCTVGLLDETRTKAHQVVFNRPFLQNNMAIRFRPLGSWMTLSQTSGVVAPGSSQQITATLSAGTFPASDYSGTIVLRTNDPQNPASEIPVAFAIGGAPQSTLSGIVSDKTTGQPVAGASIQYSGPVSGSVTTAQNGSYLVNLPAGTYNVAYHHSSYASVHRTITLPPDRTENVQLGRPIANISPRQINLTITEGSTANGSILIRNVGGADLEFFAYDSLDSWGYSDSQVNTASKRFGRDLVMTASQNGALPLMDTNSIDWISLAPSFGTVSEGGLADVVVTFDTRGVSPGTHTQYVYVMTNDPNNSFFQVTLNITINTREPENPPPPSGVGMAAFRNYMARYFTPDELANPELTGPTADYSGDGVPNLVAFAFGMDPTVADCNNPRLPQGEIVELDDGRRAVYYHYVADTSLENVLTYRTMFSRDMVNWTPIPHEVEETNGSLQKRSVVIPIGGSASNTSGIVRVEVSLRD